MANPLPWKHKDFDGWSIVGMNHYHVNGTRRLFVAMTNENGRCIKAEGFDTMELWDRLRGEAALRPEHWTTELARATGCD